jgi:hypothetical protein
VPATIGVPEAARLLRAAIEAAEAVEVVEAVEAVDGSVGGTLEPA